MVMDIFEYWNWFKLSFRNKVFHRLIQMINLGFYKLWINNYILKFFNGHPPKYNIAVILMGYEFASIGNCRFVIYEIIESEVVCRSAIP